jgi:predicted phosphoribosyltransferase
MIAHVSSPSEPIEVSVPLPERCVIVVDAALPPGLAANAAAVLALTLGATHPGLIPIGLPVLAADGAQLARIRAKALARGLAVAGFPAAGQQTTNYDEFTANVAATDTEALEWLGLALWGERRAVGRVTGSLGLLR